MKEAPAPTVTMKPLLLRARDVAAAYSISESLVAVFVRRGWLQPIHLPGGIRSTRFALEDVEALAGKIRRGELDR